MPVKKNSIKKIIIYSIILLPLIANIPPFQIIFKFFFDQNLYFYSTGDGSGVIDENVFLGRTFTFKRTTPDAFRERYPEADTIIYRNFRKNPIAFWRYSDYLFDERYTLPYMPLEEARAKRKLWKEKMIREGRAY